MLEGELVSVILPVYNAEPFIDQCMESLVSQTYPILEILVLDDGSKDASLMKLKEWQSRDSRIKITTRENRGLIASLNELIAMCSGRFIARMDADDYCHPDRIRRQVDALEAGAALIGSNCYVVDDNSRIVGSYRFEKNHMQLQVDGFFRSQFCHPSVMFDRAKIDVADLWYDPNFKHAEDFELWLRLLGKYTGSNVQSFLLYMRRGHGTNVSAIHSKEQYSSTVAAVKKHARFELSSVEIKNLRQRSELLSFLLTSGFVFVRCGRVSVWQALFFFRKATIIIMVELVRRAQRIFSITANS